nr:glycosyltransferase family 9 protein [Caldimonas mangrovi]
MDDVRSIAVLRANAVGDFVVALPALEALRVAYPDARITLLGRAWHAEFLRERPAPVDEVVAMPGFPGVDAPLKAVQDASVQERFVAEMRARRFDLALQLHGGGRHSNPLVRRLGARVTAGFHTPGAMPLDRMLPYRDLHPEVLRLLEGVALVGACGHTVEPRLAVTSHDRAEAAAVLPVSGRPLVVLQPGAADTRRCWAPWHFAAVADHFAELGADIAVNGTEAEAAAVSAVVLATQHRQRVHDLSGRLSLGGLLGLIERARLVVSNDTGPAHLARALGVATVAVYWVGNLIGHGPTASARHAAAVAWRLDCPVCGQNCMSTNCGHTASFVNDVAPDEVIALAQPLYEGPAPADAMLPETHPEAGVHRLTQP